MLFKCEVSGKFSKEPSLLVALRRKRSKAGGVRAARRLKF